MILACHVVKQEYDINKKISVVKRQCFCDRDFFR